MRAEIVAALTVPDALPGDLYPADIAQAAGCSVRAARRELERREKDGTHGPLLVRVAARWPGVRQTVTVWRVKT